jgi:hypothetical protein
LHNKAGSSSKSGQQSALPFFFAPDRMEAISDILQGTIAEGGRKTSTSAFADDGFLQILGGCATVMAAEDGADIAAAVGARYASVLWSANKKEQTKK